MNKEALRWVADAIEDAELAQQGIGFNMGLYLNTFADEKDDKTGHGCGTTACIAGWAAALLKENGKPRSRSQSSSKLLAFYNNRDMSEAGRIRFGLTKEQAAELFVPEDVSAADEFSLDDIKPAQAVRTIRHLIVTGEVDWRQTKAHKDQRGEYVYS